MALKKFPKYFFQSVQVKIPIIFGLLFFVSFQLVSNLFHQQLNEQLLSGFRTQMVSRTNLFASGATSVLGELDNQSTATKNKDLLNSAIGRDIVSAMLVNKERRVVGIAGAESQALMGTILDDDKVMSVFSSGIESYHEYIDEKAGNRMFRVIVPVLSGDNRLIGVAMTLSNMESVYTQLASILTIFTNTMVIGLVLTIVIALVIANRFIAKPVADIQRKTERIAEGEYDSENVSVNGHDELGRLAESINELTTKVREANATTEAERQRLDSVLTHMSDGVIATDRRGNIVIVNEEALQLLNVTREQVLYASIMDVFKIRHKYTYRQLLDTKDELILSTHEDSDETIVKCEFSVIRRETGFISGVVCVLTDITEQEKIERERREFVSNVSHELRTPLTSVRSYTESLIDGAWQDEAIAPQFLDVIQSETGRMIRMVTDLLLLSKMDSTQQPLEKEIIDLRHLLMKILDRFDMLLTAEEYADKAYVIHRELGDKTIWIEADQDKLIRVIDNILNNAIKYSPDGSDIICRLVESGDNIVISITDNGLGIPKKALPNIFKRFYRVDKARSREQGGTGLGLAISKDVVERHGGKIWVTSIENQGSTFFVSLPKVQFADDEEWG